MTDKASGPLRAALVGVIRDAMREWNAARDEMAAEIGGALAPLQGAVAEVAAEVGQHRAALSSGADRG